MTIKHLFIIDTLDQLNLTMDTSLNTGYALCQRGHEVYGAFVQDLSLSHKAPPQAAQVLVTARKLNFDDFPERISATAEISQEAGAFAAIHMRKEPPFDLTFIAATWWLDLVPKHVRIYNAPSALRTLNEKLAILRYPNSCLEALLSQNPHEILAFITDKAQGDAIIKPLDLYGGRGVQRFQVESGNKARSLQQLTELLKDGYPRLVQAFNSAIFDGEVRLFALGGKPLAWCLKVPQNGNFLANTRNGATLEPFKPSKELIDEYTAIAEDLMRQGVSFVGFDIIGGKLSEINLTSPRLLRAPLDSFPYYEQMALWIERDIHHAPS